MDYLPATHYIVENKGKWKINDSDNEKGYNNVDLSHYKSNENPHRTENLL